MLIAGGCYREGCERPYWRALLGSGGRAAVAVAELSPSVELYTYHPADRLADLYPIEAHGVRVHVTQSTSQIAFAYFHPLSTPAIAPQVDEITAEQPLTISGSTVLTFGFLEGDAVVNAEYAISDPQTRRPANAFSVNGSDARHLAIVLNEAELTATVGVRDIDSAARLLVSRERASAVIVKSGVRGARVFTVDGAATWVPAYESPRVFKIGSGDVFSAAFAHYWGEIGMRAEEAADLASRSVAAYCATRFLPLPAAAQLANLRPTGRPTLRPVCLIGSVGTLGNRWVYDEARWCLQSLGVDTLAPMVDGTQTGRFETAGAFLLLGDFMDEHAKQLSAAAAAYDVPIIILSETSDLPRELLALSTARITDDFATALYFVAWATA